MNKHDPGTNEAVELNINRILKLVLGKWWLVLLCAVVTAGACFGVSKYILKPKYEASVMIYINNLSFAEDNRLSGSDIEASKSLVDTYVVLLDTRQMLDQLISQAGVDLTARQVETMISTTTVDRTGMLKIKVTGGDPQTVYHLAQAIGTVFPRQVEKILMGSAASLAEPARLPVQPSSPNVMRNTVSGALCGFVLACSLILLQSLFDVTVRGEKQLAELLDYPLLARIPEHTGDSNGRNMVGPRLKPREQEGYKTLRTALGFALPQIQGARVVGVSSAMAGEGKSTSAANLAFALSQLDRRVLLLECDLRRPSLHEKLPLSQGPGLSEYLCGQAAPEDVIRLCDLRGGRFSVARAGRVPPNPSELLNSQRMEEMIHRLRREYDDIILDLPPVGEVGDALSVARYTDGTVLVVRRNYCDSLRLRAAVRQFEAVKARILGVVLNCAGK